MFDDYIRDLIAADCSAAEWFLFEDLDTASRSRAHVVLTEGV